MVQVGPFAQSPNGVYKLWISRGSASFSPSGSKTDNFMVDPFPTTPPPPPPPPPGGGGF